MTEPEQPSDDLREKAREYLDDLPAETALGNRDPQGGGKGEPADDDDRQQ